MNEIGMSEKLRFSTNVEKEIHKKVSSIRYGETLTIQTVIVSNEEKKAINRAIKKSAKYNHTKLRIVWCKELTHVKVLHEF